MKYLVNNKVGIALKPKDTKSDKYITVDVNKGDTFYIIEHNGEYVKTADYDGVVEYVNNHKDNVVITMYRTNETYKLATLFIGKVVYVKIHTFAYSCLDLVMLFNSLIENVENQEITDGKVYYDVTYKAKNSTFKARFDSITDAGVLLDGLRDEDIVEVDMIKGDKRIVSLSNFDDYADIFTLCSYAHFSEISDIEDLFEQYLR